MLCHALTAISTIHIEAAPPSEVAPPNEDAVQLESQIKGSKPCNTTELDCLVFLSRLPTNKRIERVAQHNEQGFHHHVASAGGGFAKAAEPKECGPNLFE